MSTKTYILNEKHVGNFATVVALQEGNVSFKKDNQSKLYIADVEGEDIDIPDNVMALEMNKPKEEPVKDAPMPPALPEGIPEPDENSVDLLLRLQMGNKMDPEKIQVIYDKIAKAIESAMKDMD